MLKTTQEANPTDLPDEGTPTLRTLFDSEESNLLRYAYCLTSRREVSEEIVQEVFLQLHSKWNEVKEPRAWLFRSVRNRAFHYLRKSRRESLDGDVASDGESAMELADRSNDSPEALLARREKVSELQQLLIELPEKDRRLIQLKYYEDLKYRDISERTGLTISNVGFRLHQVLKKLAVGLRLRGVEDES